MKIKLIKLSIRNNSSNFVKSDLSRKMIDHLFNRTVFIQISLSQRYFSKVLINYCSKKNIVLAFTQKNLPKTFTQEFKKDFSVLPKTSSKLVYNPISAITLTSKMRKWQTVKQKIVMKKNLKINKKFWKLERTNLGNIDRPREYWLSRLCQVYIFGSIWLQILSMVE